MGQALNPVLAPDAYAWFLFGGSVLLLMGLNLALDAEGHARSVVDWQSFGAQPPAADAPGLFRRFVLSYRVGGAFLAAAGAYTLGCLFWFPRELARWRPLVLGPAGHLAAGLVFTALGLAMSGLKMTEWAKPRGLSLRLEGEEASPEAAPTPAARLAFWSGWLVVFCFFLFGAYLLSRFGADRR